MLGTTTLYVESVGEFITIAKGISAFVEMTAAVPVRIRVNIDSMRSKSPSPAIMARTLDREEGHPFSATILIISIHLVRIWKSAPRLLPAGVVSPFSLNPTSGPYVRGSPTGRTNQRLRSEAPLPRRAYSPAKGVCT